MYTIEDDYCNVIRVDEDGTTRRYRSGKTTVFETEEQAERALENLLRHSSMPAWIETM